MRKHLVAGDIPGAERTVSDDGRPGQWTVPVDGLLAAGFHPNRLDAAHMDVNPDPEADRLREQVRLLTVERDAARQLAEERRQALDDLRTALHVLEAGQLTAPDRRAEQPNHSAEQPSRRRRWWHWRDA